MNEAKCQDCVYSVEYQGKSECRRYPPSMVVHGEQIVSLFPITERNAFCGEFYPITIGVH